MKRIKVVALVSLVSFCLIASSSMVFPTSSQSTPTYDLWADLNGDGKIDILDVVGVTGIYGARGDPIAKATLDYDSGWINITGKQGQYITVTHGLNITDWNNENIDVGIMGKATPNGTLLRNLGLTANGMQWNKTYKDRGTSNEWARALVQTTDGGYALAGSPWFLGPNPKHFWLVKTDANGNTQWNKTYVGTGEDFAYALVQTADGGYALAGYTTTDFGTYSHYDAWLVKTDAAGNMQWNRTYGGTDRDVAYALVQTTDGGYALAGYTDSFGASNGDFWLVKTDASGNMQWNRTYGGTNTDVAYALVQTTDGGYALAGLTSSFGAVGYDAWLVKTDATGNMQWNKTYGGTGDDFAYALVQTTDGGYALASGGFANLIKTDSSGNMQWAKSYGGSTRALVQTTDGGYALAGFKDSPSTGYADFWLVKTDAAGNMQWNRTYGGTNTDVAYALVQTTDGGYALAGLTASFGGNDFWLVKTDPSCQSGLVWAGSTADTITLYRGPEDVSWNFVRVRVWTPKTP